MAEMVQALIASLTNKYVCTCHPRVVILCSKCVV